MKVFSVLAIVTMLLVGCASRIERVQSPDASIRSKVSGELARDASQKEIDQLIALLRTHENPHVRSSAARILGMINHRDQRIVHALAEALSDKDWLVRRTAAHSLTIFAGGNTAMFRLDFVNYGHRAGKTVTGPLLKTLTDPSSDVQLAGTTAFGKYKDTDAVPLLIGLLVFENPVDQAHINDMNKAVAVALANQGDGRALEPLSRLLDFPNDAVARSGARAMGEIIMEMHFLDIVTYGERGLSIEMKVGSPTKAKQWWEKYGQK